jgi:hypothetical protein
MSSTIQSRWITVELTAERIYIARPLVEQLVQESITVPMGDRACGASIRPVLALSSHSPDAVPALFGY